MSPPRDSQIAAIRGSGQTLLLVRRMTIRGGQSLLLATRIHSTLCILLPSSVVILPSTLLPRMSPMVLTCRTLLIVVVRLSTPKSMQYAPPKRQRKTVRLH
jgi:hypothetical protein